MLTNIKSRITNCFSSIEKSLKSIILILVPLMVMFLVMSDRSPYNYITVIIYGLESLLIITYIIKFHQFVFDKLTCLLLIFLTTILLSQVVNVALFDFPRTLLLLSLFSIIFYQFLITLSSGEKELVYKLIVFGGLLFVAYFFVFYFKSIIHLDFGDRLGREFSDQNDLAKNLSVFAVISEVLVFKVSFRKKIFYIVSTLLFFFVILTTGSISNLLVFSLISIILVIFSTKEKKRFIAFLCVLVLFGVFVAVLQLPMMSYFKTRIVNMINSLFSNSNNVDHSFIDRFYLAQYGIRLFSSKPVFGYGYNQVQYYTWGKDSFSHNNFIELLASFGVLGFLTFEFLFFYPLFKSYKKKNIGLIVFPIIYLLIFQVFLVIFRKKIEYILLTLAYSCIESAGKTGISIRFRNKIIFIQRDFGSVSSDSNKSFYSVDI